MLKQFMESQNRIRVMSLIHEKLYQSSTLSKIDFSAYIISISSELFNCYVNDPEKIRLYTDLEDIELGIDQAIPCGLIINEILTNAYKYAFPEGFERKGEIFISLREEEDHRLKLVICDNGIGIPHHIDINNTETLGLSIIPLLADQMKGVFELDRSAGTRYVISFNRL